MRRAAQLVLLGGVLAMTAGCYHATIETGRAPSGQTIERPWANGFVFGLIPPSTVETAATCPNGVARVETQLSFLNQLVSGLTFGLYTPMTITVHCAAASASLLTEEGLARVMYLGPGPTQQQLGRALDQAAAVAYASGEPVYVAFGPRQDPSTE